MIDPQRKSRVGFNRRWILQLSLAFKSRGRLLYPLTAAGVTLSLLLSNESVGVVQPLGPSGVSWIEVGRSGQKTCFTAGEENRAPLELRSESSSLKAVCFCMRCVAWDSLTSTQTEEI